MNKKNEPLKSVKCKKAIKSDIFHQHSRDEKQDKSYNKSSLCAIRYSKLNLMNTEGVKS